MKTRAAAAAAAAAAASHARRNEKSEGQDTLMSHDAVQFV
jgi:hypothetical protein